MTKTRTYIRNAIESHQDNLSYEQGSRTFSFWSSIGELATSGAFGAIAIHEALQADATGSVIAGAGATILGIFGVIDSRMTIQHTVIIEQERAAIDELQSLQQT